MASPQKERGYTPIANELMDALARAQLSAPQFAVVMVVLRDSYGWSRKGTGPISVRRFVARTQRPLGSIHRAVRGLLTAGVLSRRLNGGLTLNKDYERWTLLVPVDNSPAAGGQGGGGVPPMERKRSTHGTEVFHQRNALSTSLNQGLKQESKLRRPDQPGRVDKSGGKDKNDLLNVRLPWGPKVGISIGNLDPEYCALLLKDPLYKKARAIVREALAYRVQVKREETGPKRSKAGGFSTTGEMLARAGHL